MSISGYSSHLSSRITQELANPLKQECFDLKHSLKQKNDEVQHLHEKISEIQNAFSEVVNLPQEEISELLKKNRCLAKENRDFKNRNLTLERKLDCLMKDRSVMSDESSSGHSDIVESQQRRIQKLMGENEYLQGELKLAKDCLFDGRDSLQRKQNLSRQDSYQYAKELEEKICELKEKIEISTASETQLKIGKNQEIQDLKMFLEAAGKEIQDLNLQISGYHTINNELLDELDKLRNQMEETSRKNEDDIKFLEEQLTFFKQDADQKEMDLQEVKGNKQDLEASIKESSLQLFEKEEKIACLETSQEDLELEIVKLKQKNRELHQDLKNEAWRSTCQDNFVGKLKAKIQKLEEKLGKFSTRHLSQLTQRNIFQKLNK